VDKFRKAVGKKIPELMAAERDHFIKGAMEHSNWSEKKATEVWLWLEPFAAYGFNKAHSVSYGRIAYITAYLKANFPAIYMSAILTAESGDVETIGIMVEECKRMGIDVCRRLLMNRTRNLHKKLGKELELFTFSDAVGKGLPLWLPKGATVRRELERFIVDEEIRRGYLHVRTPDIAKLDLYKKSATTRTTRTVCMRR
jgi:hypothetical protein